MITKRFTSVIEAVLKPSQIIDVSSLCSALAQRFGSFQITSADAYQRQVDETIQVSREIWGLEVGTLKAETFVSSIRAKEKALGSGVDIALQAFDGSPIEGLISTRVVLLKTDALENDPVVRDLCCHLQSVLCVDITFTPLK